MATNVGYIPLLLVSTLLVFDCSHPLYSCHCHYVIFHSLLRFSHSFSLFHKVSRLSPYTTISPCSVLFFTLPTASLVVQSIMSVIFILRRISMLGIVSLKLTTSIDFTMARWVILICYATFFCYCYGLQTISCKNNTKLLFTLRFTCIGTFLSLKIKRSIRIV